MVLLTLIYQWLCCCQLLYSSVYVAVNSYIPMYVLLSFLYPNVYVAVNSSIPVFMLLSSPQLSFMIVLIIVVWWFIAYSPRRCRRGVWGREKEGGREEKMGDKGEKRGRRRRKILYPSVYVAFNYYIPVFMLLSTPVFQLLSTPIFQCYVAVGLYIPVFMLLSTIFQC